MLFDGFVAPWLAEVSPATFAGGSTTILEIGALPSDGLCALAGCCSVSR